MFLKRGIITGAVLTLVLGLTGCSSSGGDSANGKIELRYAIWDKTHMEAVETLIDEFEEKNPNVDTKVE